MVRITTILSRVPVIKFRKGGGGSHAPPAAATAAPAAAAPQAINGQTTTTKESAPGMMVPRAIMLQYGKKGDVIVFKMLLQKLESKSGLTGK